MAASVTSASRPAGALSWLLLSALLIALDQWTKHLVLDHLQEGVPVAVIPGFLNWMLAFNTGAAFSFLADAGGWQRWGFSVLAVAISLVLTGWLVRTPRRDWPTALPLALVIGGAIGNLIDRLRFGHVVDFVQVYHGDWTFPAFNVADSAISVGAVLLALASLRSGKAEGTGR
ncbi:MAG: signal peptidase II [Lysobacterales bacterium 69-70]|nr:signal peptidase II [Xanthomonadaceae bacterium]ODU36073.1 MAG: signal peptidase II [Xanthomonadaceae bacterium SCN 69-320]ODV18183.1 MAG: signal peptidase II [Xanthomonadaceae bacterium SCN 69-25]OJY99466.1 MAG: signal peptidase II [Xanthomonadales bacterium 69-70]